MVLKTPYINSPRLRSLFVLEQGKYQEQGEKFESVGTRLFSATILLPQISEPYKQQIRTTHTYWEPLIAVHRSAPYSTS